MKFQHVPDSHRAPFGRWQWTTWEFRLGKRIPLAVAFGWIFLASVAFGVCGLLRVEPQTYLLVLAWGIAVGLVQWRCPTMPRLASALAGLFVFVGWNLICGLLHATPNDLPAMTDTDFILLLPFGALAGYATGTLMTGVLLFQAAAHSLTHSPRRSQSRPIANATIHDAADAWDLTAVSKLATRQRAKKRSRAS